MCQDVKGLDPPSYCGPRRAAAAAPLKGRLKPAEPAESASPPLHDPLSLDMQPETCQLPLSSPMLLELSSTPGSSTMLSLDSTGGVGDAEDVSLNQLLLSDLPSLNRRSPGMSSCSSPQLPMQQSPTLSGLASSPALRQCRPPWPAWQPQLRTPKLTTPISDRQQTSSWDAFMTPDEPQPSRTPEDLSAPRDLTCDMGWAATPSGDCAPDLSSDLFLDQSPLPGPMQPHLKLRTPLLDSTRHFGCKSAKLQPKRLRGQDWADSRPGMTFSPTRLQPAQAHRLHRPLVRRLKQAPSNTDFWDAL